MVVEELTDSLTERPDTVPRLEWIIALPIAALLLVVGGTWTYINVLRDDAPARLVLEGNVTGNLPATSVTTADLGTLPADGATITVPATGELALHGTRRP